MRLLACELCSREMNPGEPRYPVSFDDGDTAEVCVACASRLSRDGINAWRWPVTGVTHRLRGRQPSDDDGCG